MCPKRALNDLKLCPYIKYLGCRGDSSGVPIVAYHEVLGWSNSLEVSLQDLPQEMAGVIPITDTFLSLGPQ